MGRSCQINHRTLLITIGLLLAVIGFYLLSPIDPLEKRHCSTVVLARNNELIGARIAKDGQWRFPKIKTVPDKFIHCITNFEDQYFYQHLGFNPISIARAIYQNIRSRKVVSGASTITQQLVRISRQKKRSYTEKAIELTLAIRLEIMYSKSEIMKLYATHAPFGGNIVGLETASWRYFGVPSNRLSWAQMASLAVLPNAPSLIYPGKENPKLRIKRDRLLLKLLQRNIIDSSTYKLSLLEELPQKTKPLDQLSDQFVHLVDKTYPEQQTQTTINYPLQKCLQQLAKQHYYRLSANEIHNLSILVLDLKTRDVLAYIANSPTNIEHHKDVDMIQAPRSTGSTLKPILYANMLDQGELLYKQMVWDIPTKISGYVTENFNLSYSGALAANEALATSLNIPCVRLLQKYGLKRFREEIKAYNFKHINKSADHYGLSLIIGGAESSLWDLCKVYAGLGSTLSFFNENQSMYRTNEFIEPNIKHNKSLDFGTTSFEKTVIGAGSIWSTLQMLYNVNRPQTEQNWNKYSSSKKIAWKTGTSHGNKDAWAIGLTPKYVVGVWTGNANGEGRPNHTGITTAAPLLFDVFSYLKKGKNIFETPYDDLKEIKICSKSGYISNIHCPKTEKQWASPLSTIKNEVCKFHQKIQLDSTQRYRVYRNCYPKDKIISKTWFSLPALVGFYYQKKHPNYQAIPEFHKICKYKTPRNNIMEFINPKPNSKIYLPKQFNNKRSQIVCKIAHLDANATIHWHLDGQYINSTKKFHDQSISLAKGKHQIIAIDNQGNKIIRNITVEN